MSSCSIEISKGNLDFLAPILGNTQTSILFLSHRSCLAICNLRLIPCHAHLFVPSVPSRESAPLLCCLSACWRERAQPEMLRAVTYSVSVKVCVLGEKPARVRDCSEPSCPAIRWEALSLGCRGRASGAALGCCCSDQAKKLPAFVRILPTSSVLVDSRDCSPLTGRSRGCTRMFLETSNPRVKMQLCYKLCFRYNSIISS